MAELQANGVALSDQDKADARSGFGLGSAATAAASDFATAAQGTDAREWTAATVLQAEAEAGTDAARKAWTVQRVWQAAAAWWASSAAKTKLDGIASGATVNAADATLLARSNHTGTQTASTISDFSTAADARIAAASLDALANVSAPSPTNGQVLQFNGTAWVPGVVSGAGIVGTYADTTALQAAFPAGTQGRRAMVGASAPYTEYTDNGTAWVAASAGAGTVTHTAGALTPNAVVLGAGADDTKVSTGITSDGASQLNLGVSATTAGKVKLFGGTSGDATIQAAAAAGTGTVITLPATSTVLAGLAVSQTFTGNQVFTPAVDSNNSCRWTNAAGSVIAQIDASNRRVHAGGTAGGSVFSVSVASGVCSIYSGGSLAFTSSAGGDGTADTFYSRGGAAATHQFGAANAASPVAQTLRTQGPRAGTDSNTAGATFKIYTGPSTGNATPASVVIQSTVAGSSGTTAQTLVDTLSVGNATVTVTGKLSVSNLLYFGQFTTGAAPSWIEGTSYFDLTLHKLRIGGASAWETITSV